MEFKINESLICKKEETYSVGNAKLFNVKYCSLASLNCVL